MRLGPAVGNLSYHYVTSAETSAGLPVILKVGVPRSDLRHEIAALTAYDGRGCVRLLACEPDLGALLLERLEPGTSLVSLTLAGADDQAMRLAAQTMLTLWRPAPPNHTFPTVARWAAGLGRLRRAFADGVGPFPVDLVALAETLFDELLADSAEAVLLHGDLHHDNILAAQRAPWLAIDPQGVIGEPAYEVGALLRNPFPWLWAEARPIALLRRRLHILGSELGFDWARLAAWGVAQAVLSAWWAYEDHDSDWQGQLRLAYWLRALLP